MYLNNFPFIMAIIYYIIKRNFKNKRGYVTEWLGHTFSRKKKDYVWKWFSVKLMNRGIK